MADTYTFASLVNTTDNMTQLNQAIIQETLEIDGADWYIYAGTTAQKIYVHGKGSFGFGTDTDHLKIFSGNASMYKLYRQEGTLDTGTKFLKIRAEGYYYYNSNTKCAYTYEVFLFDDGNIYLYVVSVPIKYSSVQGTCTITDGKTTKSLSIPTSSPVKRQISNINVNLTVEDKEYTPITEVGARLKAGPATVYIPNALDWSNLIIESYDASESTNVVSNFVLPDDVDVSAAGTKTVNLSYKTYSVPVEILVKEDSVVEITNVYLTTHYLLGESLNVSSIKAVWESGKTETLTEGFEISGFDSSTPGTQEVQISYKGATVTQSVYVSSTGTITLSEGYKTQYYLGDELDSGNGALPTVYIEYDDGQKNTVNATFSGFDSTKAGDCVITVTASGLSTTYTVNVADTYSVNIGSETDTDIVAKLDLTTGLVTISGTGNTKEISEQYRGTGGLFDNYVFNDRVKKAVVDEGITGLGGACFDQMSALTEVTLPSTLTLLGERCFYECSGLTEVTLPSTLTALPDYCFYHCTGLLEVTVPESISAIGSSAFAGCTNAKISILNKNATITDSGYSSTLEVKLIQGYLGSTAETYAETYSVPFQFLDTITKLAVTHSLETYPVGGAIGNLDLTVKITLEDGTEQETSRYDLEYDFSTTGEKTVKVTCEDLTETFTVNVTTCTLSELIGNANGMPVIRDNSKLYGSDTDVVNGVSWFKFDNLTADKLYVSGYNWIGFGTSAKQLTICYRYGAIWNIYRLETVLNNGIKLLKLRLEGYTYANDTGTEGTQIKYEIFLFDNGDMFLNVLQSPDSTSTYAGTSLMSCNDKTTILSLNGATEENPVQVTFGHQDDSGLDWDVKYARYNVGEIIGIEITTLPDKTEYAHGESLNTTGLEVLGAYGDGSTEVVSDYTVSGFDSSKVGTQTVTVTYKTYSATFTVDVYEEISGMRISRYPDKYYYAIGEKLDTTGLEIVVQFTDGSETTLFNNSELEFTGFSGKKIGTQKVRCMTNITIGDTIYLCEDWFNVCVINDAENPFAEGSEPIDIRVHWINGEFEDLVNENLQKGSIVLQESLCDDSYFIYGGCVSNQITFKAYHKQFVSTDESSYPSGKIEVYIKRKNTELKIFTGEIASGERDSGMLTRTIIAYDYLYKWRNIDISSWYKSQTTDKGEDVLLTQKQFRDLLFSYLGIAQIDTKLKYDEAYVPNTNIPNELNLATVVKDLCLQNNVFGWMNRDGEFEYVKLKKNSKPHYPRPESEPLKYDYFEAQVHIEKFKTFKAQEGRIWGPSRFWPDPYPGVFNDGGYTAQEAYELNVYYIRNSFFIGDQDWLDKAFEADEYGYYTTANPAFPICYGADGMTDVEPQYRAQGYTIDVGGNPLNMVGSTIQMKNVKYAEDGSEVIWIVNSYIMSRTLKIGATMLMDTYSANNAPYNGETKQLGKKPYQFSQSDLPIISYSGASTATASISDTTETATNKTTLRCVKQISEDDYNALVAAGTDRADTLYFTYEEE